jgi:3-oxoacyl-[acyl-carrier protein] reductase
MGLLDGKVAIITGSGRGIGAAAAKMFAEHGARVVISDIDPNPANETAEAINTGGEKKAIVIAGDVTAPDFGENLINGTLEQFGQIDVIVNNAGYTWDGVLHKMSDKQWEAIIACHLTAPFRIVRAAAPYIRETAKQEEEANGRAKARKIVNVSSVSGLYGNAGQANYSAAKMGVVGLTKTIAKEWGRFNVQSNAVAFGFIETRLTQSKEKKEVIEREGEAVSLGIPDQNRQMAPLMIPLGRPGTPEDAAGPILFLASPLSDYVSGITIEVHGGRGG